MHRFQQIFQDNILPELIDNIKAKPGMEKLDRYLAALIDRTNGQRTQGSLNPAAIENHKDNDNQITDMEEEDDLNLCSHCSKHVTDGIGCDSCDRWNHFECEDIDDYQAEFLRHNNTNYSCLSCRHLTIISIQDTMDNSTIFDEVCEEPQNTHTSILSPDDSNTETFPKQFIDDSFEGRTDETASKQVVNITESTTGPASATQIVTNNKNSEVNAQPTNSTLEHHTNLNKGNCKKTAKEKESRHPD